MTRVLAGIYTSAFGSFAFIGSELVVWRLVPLH
jgi:hypothetical protein